MAHTFKHSVDAVILSRGADPFVPGVYVLVDSGDGGTIAAWTPPDASYGDQPTQVELDAVTEEQAEAASDQELSHIAETRLSADAVDAAIVEVLSIVAGEDVTAQVVAAIRAKL
jgi:hypothetical protein